MSLFDALILGIVQGITEFLPVSSSGHLIIGESFLGLAVDQLKSFDVAVHMGTLAAIIIYFWKDFIGLIKGFLSAIGLYKDNARIKEYRCLVGFIILATIPAVLAGLFLEDTIDFVFRTPFYVGLWMIIVGEFFIIAENIGTKYKSNKDIGLLDSLIIGVFQAIALIPGVSRSGFTIAAGLMRGVSREKAARFSFLLAMPVTFGAGLLTFSKEMKVGFLNAEIAPLLIGFVSSMAAGLVAVSFLMKYLKRHSLNVFAIYLFVVGIGTVLISILI